MNSFWINIYKPKGVNSTKVTNLVKKLFKPSKVGHAGTLDPLAEGVLPIAVGEATKTIEYIHGAKKTYEFEVILGKKSDSGDLEGKIIKETDSLPEEKELLDSIQSFVGKIKQTPPKYSAIKINGKRAYELAREDIEFEIKVREVEIYSLKLLKTEKYQNEKVRKAQFECQCSLGTYIRTLAEDICEKAGSLGVVSELKRTVYGCFDLNKILKLNSDDSKNITDNLQSLKKSIIRGASPVDVVLDDIPVLHLDQNKIERLRNGQKLDFEGEEGLYKIYENKVFSLIASRQGQVLKPRKVFNL